MKVKDFIVAGILAIFGAGVTLSPVFAAPTQSQDICSSSMPAEIKEAAGCNESREADSLVGTIVNVLLYAVGLLAVIMIIVSGIKMITSAGDAGAVTKARNTLLYAIVGLIVAVLAYAIVNFVLKKVG